MLKQTARQIEGTAADKTALETALRSNGLTQFRIKRIRNGLRLCLTCLGTDLPICRKLYTEFLNSAGYSLIPGVQLQDPLSWNQPHEIFLRKLR